MNIAQTFTTPVRPLPISVPMFSNVTIGGVVIEIIKWDSVENLSFEGRKAFETMSDDYAIHTPVMFERI